MLNDNKIKYLYRRQYLFAPKYVDTLKQWNKHQVCDNYCLTSHPDLPITIANFTNKLIYLLGYIIDPFNPLFDDLEIIQAVLSRSNNLDDIFDGLADKCGRFVIISKINNDYQIFSDSCGLRQVFYHIDKDNLLWCSSQPHLIAEQLGLEININIKNNLKKARLFNTSEYWYPGQVTLFENVYHLLPNNYLDINKKKIIRYWPKKRLSKISMIECIPKVSELLGGIIEGATNRFNIAFSISSGYDSRTLLAASRKVSKKIHYFTQSAINSVNRDPDVIIPTEMLNDLDLKHDVLVLPEKYDEDFKKYFENNVITARMTKGLNVYSIYEHFNTDEKEIVVINGNCSEITKRDRFRFPKTPKAFLNGTVLAAMAQMSGSKIAINEFDKWVAKAKKLTKYNIDILDLMHWEQRVGNWGSMTFSEYDMIHESLSPYSCRRYIELMLSVPFKYRTKPSYKLHREIMAANWPEVLEYEINPENNLLKKKIEDFLYKTNIYDPIKLLFLMFYKRFK